MKKDKAAGSNNLYVEVIENSEQLGINTVIHLCNDIYRTGYIQQEHQYLQVYLRTQAISG
jgi:hypothetical protein